MTISDWMAGRISSLCEQRGMTINQLAIAAGITQSTLNSIIHKESRNPTVTSVFKICQGLNITMSQFFQEIEYGEFEDIS